MLFPKKQWERHQPGQALSCFHLSLQRALFGLVQSQLKRTNSKRLLPATTSSVLLPLLAPDQLFQALECVLGHFAWVGRFLAKWENMASISRTQLCRKGKREGSYMRGLRIGLGLEGKMSLAWGALPCSRKCLHCPHLSIWPQRHEGLWATFPMSFHNPEVWLLFAGVASQPSRAPQVPNQWAGNPACL